MNCTISGRHRWQALKFSVQNNLLVPEQPHTHLVGIVTDGYAEGLPPNDKGDVGHAVELCAVQGHVECIGQLLTQGNGLQTGTQCGRKTQVGNGKEGHSVFGFGVWEGHGMAGSEPAPELPPKQADVSRRHASGCVMRVQGQ